MKMCVSLSLYTYIYTYMHTYKHTSTYTYIYIYIQRHIKIHTYILGKKKRKRVVEDSDDEGPETNHPRHRPSAEAGPSSSKEPTSAESLAGLARAETRLPSRKRALVELMKLQARLAEEGRDAESAVCTNAVFTIQELLKRVERL